MNLSTLYSLSQSIAWLQSGELRIAEILQTDGRTDGRTDGHQVFEQRAEKPHYTKRSNNKNVSKFSRNMFTEIRCEICINHFVEKIFTLSCAVVDINLLQIIHDFTPIKKITESPSYP